MFTWSSTCSVSSFGVPDIWHRLLNVSGHVKDSVLLVIELDKANDAVPGVYVSLLYVIFIASTVQFGVGQSALVTWAIVVDEGEMKIIKTSDRMVINDSHSALKAISFGY